MLKTYKNGRDVKIKYKLLIVRATLITNKSIKEHELIRERGTTTPEEVAWGLH